jgi:hypothetical protein
MVTVSCVQLSQDDFHRRPDELFRQRLATQCRARRSRTRLTQHRMKHSTGQGRQMGKKQETVAYRLLTLLGLDNDVVYLA